MNATRRGVLSLAVAAWAGWAGAEDVPLSQILPNLLGQAIVTPSSRNVPAGQPGIPHEAHFVPALAQQSAAYDLNRSLVTYLSTFPLGSSSGGFTYELDEKTGIPKRSSTTFGPSFTDRALTIGKGKWSAGVNFQAVRYDQFEGLDLQKDLVFYLQHNDCCPLQSSTGLPGGGGTQPGVAEPAKDPAFEGDLIRLGLALDVKNDTTAFFANYGLTDRLEIGLAVPLVRVQVDARIDARIERLSSTNPLIHTFSANQDVSSATFSDSGSKTGLGDVAVRAKYNFWHAPGGGLAAGLDLRLPTGDEDNLLGVGGTQAKLALVFSRDWGKLSPRASLGYTFSSGQLSDNLSFSVPQTVEGQNVLTGQPVPSASLDVPDELNFSAGLSLAATPGFTINVDALGRTISDTNRFGVVSQGFPYRTANAGPLSSAQRDLVDITGQGSLTSLIGVAGVKLNLTRTLLLNANALFPLNDGGLRIKFTPVIGFDYTF